MASRQIGRDARTGQFISIRDAKANPATSVVETYNAPRPSGRSGAVKRRCKPGR